jgi:hypothetical protein
MEKSTAGTANGGFGIELSGAKAKARRQGGPDVERGPVSVAFAPALRVTRAAARRAQHDAE